jgi:hypothetical protein
LAVEEDSGEKKGENEAEAEGELRGLTCFFRLVG